MSKAKITLGGVRASDESRGMRCAFQKSCVCVCVCVYVCVSVYVCYVLGRFVTFLRKVIL